MLDAMSSDQSSSTHLLGEPKSEGQATQPLDPGLYVVSTPIGNLRDITLRALDVLSSADEILAEDTRVARRLLDAHDIRAKVSPYHDHNGAMRRPEILEKLEAGAAIALISDAGTPLVSDPGYKLVREVSEAGHKVIPIPGASALLAGLVTSGLPSDRFMFCGFLPAKSGARKAEALSLAEVPASLIFYETGPRLADSLSDLAKGLSGDREAAVARELTKLFEETLRGTLQSLADHYRSAPKPKGEIVLLVGPPVQREANQGEVDEALKSALQEMPVKQAANQVAEMFGLSKREAYQRALALKDG
ncbi:MAG: 16S rRNA (cytidine(1402)-2'-O)-methyltransferase [Pseudomonadota bacterium]